MGLEELLQSLKENEQKQIESIWQQVRDEADSLRRDINEAMDSMTAEHAEHHAAACRRSIRGILSKAGMQAREKKLQVHQSLNKALFAAALQQLSRLRQEDYENVFAQLVRELPGIRWQKVKVNPADEDLAAGFFDRNAVYTDTSVSGGLVAFSGDGKIQVDNSLEKRLERKWPYLLPELIKKIEEQYGKSAEKN